MARRRSHVPVSTVQRLIREAGYKCANPGCAVTMIELHHIQEWHVYGSHDPGHMIALCAACHDHVHRGELRLDDETLYQWKRIGPVKGEPHWASVSAQPRARELPLLLGPFAIASRAEEAGLLRLGGTNWLTLRVLQGGVVQVDTEIRNAAGEEVLRVVRSQAIVERKREVEFKSAPGRVLVTVPATEDFIPSWVLLNLLRISDSFIRQDGRAVALDIEVTEPGQIRVEGYWLSKHHAAAITSKAVLVASYSTAGPITLGVDGEGAPPILGGDHLRADQSYFGLDFSLGGGFEDSIIEVSVTEALPSQRFCLVVFKDLSKIEIVQNGSQWSARARLPESYSFQFGGQLLRAVTLARRFCDTLVSLHGTRKGVWVKFVDHSEFRLSLPVGVWQRKGSS